MTRLCDENRLQQLMNASAAGADDELTRADQLLSEFPEDARLHFLRGSMLAGIGRPLEALPALKKAVDLAPEFAIARFQLGFFLLTSGEATEALSVWGPLALLAEDHYLRLFVAGLTHLIRDEFDLTVRYLREGIETNHENPPLNRDMQLLIDQVGSLTKQPASPVKDDSMSATSFLLDQYARRGRPH